MARRLARLSHLGWPALIAGVGAGCALLLAACSPVRVQPTLNKVVPAAIAPGQPSFLLVEGTEFASGALLQINGVDVPSTWINGDVITVTSPALAAGAYDVVVRNPGGTSARLASGLHVGPTATPAATAQATNSPRNSPTPTPSPSPTPTPAPSPTPSPSPTPTPAPTPTPSPTPPPTPSPRSTAPPFTLPSVPTQRAALPPLPASALEAIACQPQEFGGSAPSERQHLTNQQAAAGSSDPQAALQSLSDLGRNDGYRVTYDAAPGQPARPRSATSTTCYAEQYGGSSGAAGALSAVGAFPADVQVRESSSPGVGTASRTFVGTITDPTTRRQAPITLIVWQRNRFLGTVTLVGIDPSAAVTMVLRVAASMDSRMAQYP